MKYRAMATVCLLGALAVGVSHPCSAQNAIGGVTKTKQNAVGGAAKPGPVIGGSTAPASVVGGTTKPGSAGGVTKQSSVGGTPTPGSTGSATSSTGNTAKQNPPVTPPNKGGTVVTTSNLKCGAGSCVAKGTKP